MEDTKNFFLNCVPYKHQEDELQKSLSSNARALLWEVGTGKTLAAITILRSKFAIDKKMMRTLILCPSVVIGNWKKEILEFSKINNTSVLALSDSTTRVKLFNKHCLPDHPMVVIVNYEALLGDMFLLLQKWDPEIIIADELHYLKNHKSKRTKQALALSKKAKYKIGLTGTAVLNSPTDIFAQYQFLDPTIFGTNFFVFQRTYMFDANTAWAGSPTYFPKWRARPEKFEELNQKIGLISSIVKKETCLDLPPLVKMIREVELSKEQAEIYKDMKNDLVAFLAQDQTASASIALVKALRLQQIVCGFVTQDSGEEYIIPGPNPRLRLLEELLEQITPAHKVVVWCCFKRNYVQIVEVCEKLKIEHVLLTGAQDNEDKEIALDTFRVDPDCRVIIANRFMGLGFNLVEASYSIVFSRNFSLAEEIQSEGRNYRGGSQIHKCVTKIDLCAKGTIDELVCQNLTNKKEVSSLILKEIK